MDEELTREVERRRMFLKSLELSKKLTPEQRYAAFLDLQEALVDTYFQGLKARFPGRSDKELLEIARKENVEFGK